MSDERERTQIDSARAAASADARSRANALIASCHVMTLASVGANGPWIAPVFYAVRFDASGRPWLVFVSSPSSRHATEFDADPRVAAAIHGEANDWQTILGVQIAGFVRALDGDELRMARESYAARFPQIGDPARAPEPIARALARARWFGLRVERIFLTDNAVAFGLREELVYPRIDEG